MEAPVISAERLTLSGHPPLDQITFEVARGTIFGLIGAQGSGKTALLQVLTGRQLPSDGFALVFGESPGQFSDRVRRKIGYLAKFTKPYPNLTVRENLNFYAS